MPSEGGKREGGESYRCPRVHQLAARRHPLSQPVERHPDLLAGLFDPFRKDGRLIRDARDPRTRL